MYWYHHGTDGTEYICMRARVRGFASTAGAALPPSPLAAYKAAVASGSAPRTGYTHFFSQRSGVDRSAAAEVRLQCRSGAFDGQTSGMAPGFVQANFVALPQA